ncbi:hypothetical protein ACFY19_23595 [Streptosporangium saharense]|uniref:hypothetical protein n=1 Tax=Streptosporangium saharense TaxID=1706840 RepID=UPI0036A1716D
MSMMRAGLMAVLVGTAAVGAVQHSKPGHDRSTSWTVKRQGPSAGKHAGRWTTRRANQGNGRRGWHWGRGNRRSAGTEWADNWRSGWSRRSADRNTLRTGGGRGFFEDGVYGGRDGRTSRKWTFERSDGRGRGYGRSGGRGDDRFSRDGRFWNDNRSRYGGRSWNDDRSWSGGRFRGRGYERGDGMARERRAVRPPWDGSRRARQREPWTAG